jgi:hypothetical protein
MHHPDGDNSGGARLDTEPSEPPSTGCSVGPGTTLGHHVLPGAGTPAVGRPRLPVYWPAAGVLPAFFLDIQGDTV